VTALTTIPEIKAAVDAGQTVYADTKAYQVVKGTRDQYLIHFTGSDHYIGLHGAPGTPYEHKLNASRFFTD
jgi:hypothetical protein